MTRGPDMASAQPLHSRPLYGTATRGLVELLVCGLDSRYLLDRHWHHPAFQHVARGRDDEIARRMSERRNHSRS
jgi:hypothetical protein